MKKRPAIGVTVVILIFSVIVGIAAIPDEVLIESSELNNSKISTEEAKFVPNKIGSAEQLPIIQDETKNDNTKTELAALKNEIKELKKELVGFINDSQPAHEMSKYDKNIEDAETTKSETNVIRINIKDGVGAKER